MLTVPRPMLPGGRPSREESARRTGTLIEVATALFLERGYEATSMEQVAIRARVGKRTLYARFPDKKSLFAAVVHNTLERWANAATVPLRGNLEERLIEASRSYLHLTVSAEAMSFYRLLVAEMGRYPELSQLLSDEVEQRGPNLLEQTLQGCLKDGLIRGAEAASPDWAHETACLLSGALIGEPRRHIIILRRPMDAAALDSWMRRVVSLFVKGLA